MGADTSSIWDYYDRRAAQGVGVETANMDRTEPFGHQAGDRWPTRSAGSHLSSDPAAAWLA